MIPERFMVSGVPIGGGERVIGYLHSKHEHLKDHMKTIPCCIQFVKSHNGGYEHFESAEVDSATIQAARVKPITPTERRWFHCPNCLSEAITHDITGVEFNYCPDCGMALDWTK